MKEGTAHLKHMKEITDRLAALEAHTDGVSLSFVQQALRHEEQKLVGGTGASNSCSESQPSSALVSMEKRYKPWKTKCFGC